MKTLLAIVEQGGYPDFTSFYQSLGYQVQSASSMRKALNLLKQHQPDVIIAEFNYSPMYSARISNLESLLAVLQGKAMLPKLVILSEQEVRHHIKKLDIERYQAEVIIQPVTQDKILNCLTTEESVH